MFHVNKKHSEQHIFEPGMDPPGGGGGVHIPPKFLKILRKFKKKWRGATL